jgi:hypothetical protein
MCDYRRNDCVCESGAWSCDGFTQGNDDDDADAGTTDNGGGSCPAQEPEDDSDCSEPGTMCDYGQNSCGCFGGAWRC